MWVADAADGSRLNTAATDLVMTAGTVVLTGGTVDGADITSFPGGWSQFIARYQAVPVDTANPNS